MNSEKTFDDQNREIMALASDVADFRISPLGKYLVDRADLEALEAQDALTRVDPEDTKEIRRLQNIVWRSNSFKSWLEELETAGEIAYQQYVSDQQQHGLS